MDIAATYAASRARMLDMARSIDDGQAVAPVPACPEWTVKDVYAHLAGVVDDVLNGRLEGVATDPWTARQIDARRERTLDEICEEWASNAEPFDALLVALGDEMDPRLLIDVWTHEQDLRGALGRPGARDGELVVHVVGTLIDLRSGWSERGLPPLRIRTTSCEACLGDGEPVATLTTTDFEYARLALGRRTPDQVAALDWTGDASPFYGQLHTFGPAAEPVIE